MRRETTISSVSAWVSESSEFSDKLETQKLSAKQLNY